MYRYDNPQSPFRVTIDLHNPPFRAESGSYNPPFRAKIDVQHTPFRAIVLLAYHSRAAVRWEVP